MEIASISRSRAHVVGEFEDSCLPGIATSRLLLFRWGTPGQQSMPSTDVHVMTMEVLFHFRVTGNGRHQNDPQYEQHSEQP